MKLIPLSIFLLLATTLSAATRTATTATELSQLLNETQPGDTIKLASGEWPDLDLRITLIGTANSPITLTGATNGETRITGRSHIGISGEHIILSHLNFSGVEPLEENEAILSFRTKGDHYASYCQLRHSAFDRCNPADPARRYAWIRLYGSNNRIDHNRFQGQAHSGVTIQVMVKTPDAAHRIDHNHFIDRPKGDGNGFECIQIGQSQDSQKTGRCIVEANIFERCDGETEIVSSKTCNNIIRKNLFYESSGTLTLRHGNETLAEENIFIGNKKPDTGGIRVIGTDHIIRNNYFQGLTGGVIVLYAGIPDSPLNGYFAADRATVEGNQFYDCQEPLIQERGGYGKRGRSILPKDCNITNNPVLKTAPTSLNLLDRTEVGPDWLTAR